MVDDLRRALELLTVYRPRAADTWSPELVGSAMAYYPLVGAGIGCALWCLYLLLAYVFPPPVVAALLLAGLCLVTGGVHLNGLATTLDGLSGGNDRQSTLRIFKEQHPGTTGVMSVVLALLIKFACLSVVPDEGMLLTLVLLGTLSRYAMVQVACFSAYARPGGGFGEPFVRGARTARPLHRHPAVVNHHRRVLRRRRRGADRHPGQPGGVRPANLFPQAPGRHHRRRAGRHERDGRDAGAGAGGDDVSRLNGIASKSRSQRKITPLAVPLVVAAVIRQHL